MLLRSRQIRVNLEEQSMNVELGGCVVSQVDTCQYLRVTLDHNLSFKADIDSNISPKINRVLGILKRCSPCIPQQTRVVLYNALARPILTTALLFGWWPLILIFPNCKDSRIEEKMLIAVQCPPGPHTTDLLSQLPELGWLTVCDRGNLHYSILVYKAINGPTHEHFDLQATLVSSLHIHISIISPHPH